MYQVVLALVLLAAAVAAAPRRVLYITTSAGFRHDSLPVSAEVLNGVGVRTGLYELTHTEDLRVISAESLRGFDAVLFFTSGELALSDSQKRDLLEWVRAGGAFGGFHSATDTLYSWAEYGELIGGYFDGHPWTQAARVVKAGDAAHPVTEGLPSPWTLVEEYYQFRDFRADRVRVLLELDTSSVDLRAEGVRAASFPLAWVRDYGAGRVFYTALGHFDGTWTDATFGRLLENALRWLLGGSAIEGVGNAASMVPLDAIAPGSLISIYGRGLGAGPVSVGGLAAAVVYASDTQVNARVAAGLSLGAARVEIGSASREVRVVAATPGIFAATTQPGAVTLWMTGLGGSRAVTATVAGRDAAVLYAGPAPGFPGLDQVNVAVPDGVGAGRASVVVSVAGFSTSASAEIEFAHGGGAGSSGR